MILYPIYFPDSFSSSSTLFGHLGMASLNELAKTSGQTSNVSAEKRKRIIPLLGLSRRNMQSVSTSQGVDCASVPITTFRKFSCSPNSRMSITTPNWTASVSILTHRCYLLVCACGASHKGFECHTNSTFLTKSFLVELFSQVSGYAIQVHVSMIHMFMIGTDRKFHFFKSLLMLV